MTKKILDEFVMQIIPETKESETKKFEKNIEKSTERSVASGLKKGFTSKTFKVLSAGLATAIASSVAIGIKTTSETIDNIKTQLDVADNLATRASQTGLDLKNFLKLQKLFEFSDVNPEVASQAIVEFQKRLGEFRLTGAQKEVFDRLNITKETSDTEALLRAISAIQKLQGSEKQVASDKFFGGVGNEALAEFLSGDLKTQLKAIENIDFEKLALQVQKGSDEQSKITKAETEARTKKLLESDLDASLSVQKIQSEADREIAKSNAKNVAELAKTIETSKNIWNNLTVAITKLTNSIAGAGNEVVDSIKNSDIISD